MAQADAPTPDEPTPVTAIIDAAQGPSTDPDSFPVSSDHVAPLINETERQGHEDIVKFETAPTTPAMIDAPMFESPHMVETSLVPDATISAPDSEEGPLLGQSSSESLEPETPFVLRQPVQLAPPVTEEPLSPATLALDSPSVPPETLNISDRPGTFGVGPSLVLAPAVINDQLPVPILKVPSQTAKEQRPDTAAYLGPLPARVFFPEGPGSDDDEEESEGEEAEDVFAFRRPQTAAAPIITNDSDLVAPTTAGTFAGGAAPSTAGTRRSILSAAVSNVPVPSPTGAIDVGGHLPEVTYDMEHPPPFSGRNNLNNSSFAFSMSSRRRSTAADSTAASSSNIPSSSHGPSSHGQRYVGRMTRGRLGTAATGVSTMTTTATTASGRSSFDESSREALTDVMSVDSGAEIVPFHETRPVARRIKSSTPLVDGVSIAATSEGGTTTRSGTRRGHSRHSYGMTELSGEMTVPDGKTTWGDGVGGGLVKESSDVEEGSSGEINADLIEEDSPYAEVRASVSNIDDPDMPALTLRAFVLGIVLSCFICAANTFFSFRNPTPTIPTLVVQVVAYPIGKFLAWCLPIRDYQLPSWLGGRTFSLNPCPFNVKEHTIIVMMANVSILPAYGMYTIVSSQLWYGKDFGVGFSILYVLATQVTGLSMAGIARRFVVWPASMIWPGVLVVTTNLNTLHAESDSGSGSMSRFRFFVIATGCAWAWYWVPGFLFPALSYFSYPCWIAPLNSVVNQLFGVNTGLGMGILTFDWSQIAFIGSPLTAPWWAEVNVGIGFLLFYWIITPILFYTNTWYTAYLPMSATQAADRFQNTYNVTAILTPDFKLNETAYELYSPVYLTAAFTVTYMLAFALTTSLIVYTVLYHGPRIWRAVRNMKTEADDIHMKLMYHYPEVPDWWYLIVFVLCLVLGIVTVEVFSTGLPVWGYIVAVVIALVYVIPSAFIYAMTNLEPAFNLIAELIPGYAFVGQPIPGMIFKTFAVQTLTEALYFVRDMKLGHYMKIPPRSMFIAQMSACSVACFIQVGIKEWMFATIPDMCVTHQQYLLVCTNAKTVFTSSVIWGLVGPGRLFNKGGIYRPQLWMLLIGAIVPIPIWLWCRRYPRSIFRNINVSVIFCVALVIPPASGINLASFLLVGFVFQYWIRRRSFAWWSKYNYVLSAALDVGTLSSAIFIFLCLGLPEVSLTWWGSTVFENTLDWEGAPLYTAPVTGFGPSTWPS